MLASSLTHLIGTKVFWPVYLTLSARIIYKRITVIILAYIPKIFAAISEWGMLAVDLED